MIGAKVVGLAPPWPQKYGIPGSLLVAGDDFPVRCPHLFKIYAMLQQCWQIIPLNITGNR